MKLEHKTKNTLKYPKFGLKVRTGQEQFEAKSAKKIRKAEPEQNFNGFYKNRVYFEKSQKLFFQKQNDLH